MDVGDSIDGGYQLVRLLGEGGFGQVFEAVHEQGRFALKFLRPKRARDQHTLIRFFREAIAAAAIDSQHIVKVHDWSIQPFGQLPEG